jgi:hypothetical protein
MKFTTIAVAALSLALLAACGKNDERPAASGSTTPRNQAAPQSTPSAPVTSSANSGKSEQTPPVQGQVDTKDGAQQKDFQHPQTDGK